MPLGSKLGGVTDVGIGPLIDGVVGEDEILGMHVARNDAGKISRKNH